LRPGDFLALGKGGATLYVHTAWVYCSYPFG
jgi:hypothetical protein